jgi:hypothetical protein
MYMSVGMKDRQQHTPKFMIPQHLLLSLSACVYVSPPAKCWAEHNRPTLHIVIGGSIDALHSNKIAQ